MKTLHTVGFDSDQFKPVVFTSTSVFIRLQVVIVFFFLGAKNVNMDDEEWRNPHCVATVLKMYLNELPTCLFTEEKYSSFVKIFRGKSILLEV